MCGIGLILLHHSPFPNISPPSISSLYSSLNSILSSRGPSSPNQQLSYAMHNTLFSLHSSVLHMNGIIKQPYIYGRNNVVCYNGEIYGIETRHEDCNIIIPEDTKPNIRDDTKLFSKIICNAMDDTSCGVVTHKQFSYILNNGTNNDSYSLMSSDSNSSREHMALVKALSNIQGEYSFIFYRKSTRNSQTFHKGNNNKSTETHCIYFGRDQIGRRSLLMTRTSNSTIPNTFLLSSISLNSTMVEIPPGRIYQLNIKTKSIRYIHIFHKVNYKFYRSLCENNIKRVSKVLYRLLHQSVRRRVRNLPQDTINEVSFQQVTTPHSNLAILFSGGLDSVLLSAISHYHLPKNQTVDLLNISFSNTSNYNTPDRLSAIKSYQELNTLYKRNWRLIFINISYEDILDNKRTIQYLIEPCNSKMDFNIGTALYFLARGIGIDCNKKLIYSHAKAILIGTGADEYTGGYKRHRIVYNKGGYYTFKKELLHDQERIWKRNLGRDDRILSFYGRECRFPYLDENFVRFIKSCEVRELCDMKMDEGVGDKRVLRLIAEKMGFGYCVGLRKRAIQFGSRVKNIAEVT